MTDPVAALPGATVSPATAFNPVDLYGLPNSGPEDNSAIDQDAFLKLLVAQLKYQNPLEPTSNEEFISITAQFTTVERLNELAEQGRSRSSNDALNTASALVGRSVTVLDGLGRPTSVAVNEAQLIGGDVRLITDAGVVSLDQIMAIGPMTSSTASPSSTPSSSSTSPTTQSNQSTSSSQETTQ